MKVMYIEDNYGDVKIIEHQLKSFDPSIDFCHSPDAFSGVELARIFKPDIILLDLNLGVTKGIDTFNIVYKELEEIPIIVVSGIQDDSLSKQAKIAGAIDYLWKGYINKSFIGPFLELAIEKKKVFQENHKQALIALETVRKFFKVNI